MDTLGSHIPIIALPPALALVQYPSNPQLSSFRPTSTLALRSGLFRSPETLCSLRSEAADRFLKWREVERAVGSIRSSPEQADPARIRVNDKDRYYTKWSKAEWESSLSEDVARRLREDTVTEEDRPHRPCTSSFLDPLHLHSILLFSVSLLTPLRTRVHRSFVTPATKWMGCRLGLAIIGAFCAGIGIGLAFG